MVLASKEDPRGGPALGFYLIPISGQARWFYFLKVGPLNVIFVLREAWYEVRLLLSDVSPLQFRSNLHLWLERKKQQPWLMKLMKTLQNWHQTVAKVHEVYFVEHCCHVYQTHRYTFPHLEPYCFWTFRSRYVKILNLTQTKRLPNPVLLLFPDSCFDQAGRSLEEKPRRNKIYVPNLDRWISLNKLALKVCKNCFLGKLIVTCLSTLSLLRTFQSGQLICGMREKKNNG